MNAETYESIAAEVERGEHRDDGWCICHHHYDGHHRLYGYCLDWDCDCPFFEEAM